MRISSPESLRCVVTKLGIQKPRHSQEKITFHMQLLFAIAKQWKSKVKKKKIKPTEKSTKATPK